MPRQTVHLPPKNVNNAGDLDIPKTLLNTTRCPLCCNSGHNGASWPAPTSTRANCGIAVAPLAGSKPFALNNISVYRRPDKRHDSRDLAPYLALSVQTPLPTLLPPPLLLHGHPLPTPFSRHLPHHLQNSPSLPLYFNHFSISPH